MNGAKGMPCLVSGSTVRPILIKFVCITYAITCHSVEVLATTFAPETVWTPPVLEVEFLESAFTTQACPNQAKPTADPVLQFVSRVQ